MCMKKANSRRALPPLRLRPNTTNNERRLARPRLVIAAAGNTIDAMHRRTALRDLRTWSLEPSGRAQMFGDPEIWSKVVKGACPGQPECVRVEALGQYIKQNTQYGDAITFQLALVVPVSY